MPFGFTNDQAGALANDVNYGFSPGQAQTYMGFGNNAGGAGYTGPGGLGFDGGYDFRSSGPGSDDPVDLMRWLAALGGTVSNGVANVVNNSLPVTVANKIGGIFGAPNVGLPTTNNTLGNAIYSSLNPPPNIPYTPSMTATQMNQSGPPIAGGDHSADYGYGEAHPSYDPNAGFTAYNSGGPSFTTSFGFGADGSPGSFMGSGGANNSLTLGGPGIATMAPFNVNDYRTAPDVGFTSSNGNGGSSGNTNGIGFDPGGDNTLPPFVVNDPKYTPPLPPTMLPPPTQLPPPQITPPPVGFTPPPVTAPTTNPPTVNPPTINPPGIGPTLGPGGGGPGGPTTTSGDRNAYNEGLAQNFAQSGLAPLQQGLYNSYSGANAATDARNLGTSLFGFGGPSTIADQSSALTARQQDPLLQQQNAIAAQLLSQGGDLSASDLRNVQQSSRAGYAARGLDATNSSIVDEAMQTDQARRQRLIQNLGIASGVVGQNQAQTGLINANNNSLFGLAGGLTTASNAYTRNQFDPFNGYGMDLANTNYNAGQSRANAAQNNALALTIAGMNADAAKSAATTSTLGSIFGGWLGRG